MDLTKFVGQVVKEITGVLMHNIVVLKSTVAEIIDALGGLDIEVKRCLRM